MSGLYAEQLTELNSVGAKLSFAPIDKPAVGASQPSS